VKMLRFVPALVLGLALTAGSAAAQSATANDCAWQCSRVNLPLGFSIAEITDDGSFVTLEDGSIWEIRLPQRPVASSWQPGDFVEVRNVHAPVDRFEILLARGDNDRAEARLAGRKQASGAAGQQ
jgi:hypothetical protein